MGCHGDSKGSVVVKYKVDVPEGTVIGHDNLNKHLIKAFNNSNLLIDGKFTNLNGKWKSGNKC